MHRYNVMSEGKAGRELDPLVPSKLCSSQARPPLVERLDAGRRLTLVPAPARVGKTRLAIEVGSRMYRGFPRGVMSVVDMSLISNPSRVPAALARGAGLHGVESPRPPMILSHANVAPPSFREHLGHSSSGVAVGCAGSIP
jgi:hypothetical protein